MIKDFSPLIREVLSSAGVWSKEGPKFFTVYCYSPDHNDQGNPNMRVYKSSGLGHCYRCGVTIHILKLAKDKGIKTTVLAPAFVPKPKEFKQEIEDYKGMPFPVGYTIFDQEIPQLSLSKETVKDFDIGYCKYGLDGTIELAKCESCSYNNWVPKSCEDCGHKVWGSSPKVCPECKSPNIKYGDMCEFAAGRVMTPIHFNDLLCAIESRDITKLAYKKVVYPTNSKISFTIFNNNRLKRDKPLYVVEGIKSALKLYQILSKNVTAIFSNLLKGNQPAILRSFKHIILIPDEGAAGDQTITSFRELKIPCLDVVKLPTIPICKDCGSKFRGDLSKPCPSCDSSNLTYCDAFDFSIDVIQRAIDNCQTYISRGLSRMPLLSDNRRSVNVSN